MPITLVRTIVYLLCDFILILQWIYAVSPKLYVIKEPSSKVITAYIVFTEAILTPPLHRIWQFMPLCKKKVFHNYGCRLLPLQLKKRG